MKRLGVALMYLAAIAVIILVPLWALGEAFGASAREEPNAVRISRWTWPGDARLTALARSGSLAASRARRGEPLTRGRLAPPASVASFRSHPGHWSGQRPWTPWIAAIVRQHGGDVLFDVDTNIALAFRMSGGGRRWHPWTCSRLVG